MPEIAMQILKIDETYENIYTVLERTNSIKENCIFKVEILRLNKVAEDGMTIPVDKPDIQANPN